MVGFFLYIGMKLFPMYQEYYAVRSAMKSLANEPGVGSMEPARIQDLFFKRLYINYSDNVKPANVKFDRSTATNRRKLSCKPLIQKRNRLHRRPVQSTRPS